MSIYPTVGIRVTAKKVLVLGDNAPDRALAWKLYVPEAPTYPVEELVKPSEMSDDPVPPVPDWFAAGSVNAAEAIPDASGPVTDVESVALPSQ